ncbi:hypothetical protein HMPREF1486_05978 [Streptomyces sp. HPH0547]|nr:hypothetical protein HMPREF1486_05978 [Streptomyces sp. HPH0547]
MREGPTGGGGRRGRTRFVLGGVVGCLLLLGGVLYATGTIHTWREHRQLDRACGGNLAPSRIRTALGSERVGASDTKEDGALASCEATTRNGGKTLTFRLRWGPGDERMMKFLGRTHPSGYNSPLSPLGSWPGVLREEAGATSASLWLRCDRKDHRSLIVETRIEGGPGAVTAPAPAQREKFAAVVVATAEKAAGSFGCDQVRGGSLAGLGGSPRKKPVTLAEARGTCAALRPTESSARRLGLGHVWEARASGTAPVEDCVLTTEADPQLPAFSLSAYYGPFAEGYSEQVTPRVAGKQGVQKDGWRVWATAKCPGTETRALYVLSGVVGSDAEGTSGVPVKKDDPGFRTEALTAFARQSAERHHCAELALP